eukprot:scaffold2923_cov313-Pinguiococcus_pyrenoidosus.AAC.5
MMSCVMLADVLALKPRPSGLNLLWSSSLVIVCVMYALLPVPVGPTTRVGSPAGTSFFNRKLICAVYFVATTMEEYAAFAAMSIWGRVSTHCFHLLSAAKKTCS